MFQQLVHRVSVFTGDVQDCFIQRDAPIFNKVACLAQEVYSRLVDHHWACGSQPPQN